MVSPTSADACVPARRPAPGRCQWLPGRDAATPAVRGREVQRHPCDVRRRAPSPASSARVTTWSSTRSPGTYSSLSMHKRTSDSCVEIHCTAHRELSTTEPERLPDRGRVHDRDHPQSDHRRVRVDHRRRDVRLRSLRREPRREHAYVRIANNVFEDSTDHDVSTKERESYAEVIDNFFLHCRRHCWEIGQNGNIPSRPSTTATSVFRGNIVTFDDQRPDPALQPHLLSREQRFPQRRRLRHQLLAVLDDLPRRVQHGPRHLLGELDGVRAAQDHGPQQPVRRAQPLRFTGRGVTNDIVLIQGNTGVTPSCTRGSMDSQNSGTSAAHSNEETTAPPRLDPASDVTCP